ncbi:MAG: hybrid sensor histidine kinase/response regulator [Myxococcales bacterium]|nr:hybrid sensor histidine kinase/response regulator [Myxococcales bacterium]
MTAKSLSILIVDDDATVRAVYRNHLRSDPTTRYDVAEVGSGEEALRRCRKRSFDCVILDYSLPDVDGLQILSELVEDASDPGVTVVMLTGAGNETVAVESMKRGCQDYVSKTDLSAESLVKAVHNAVEKVSLRRELQRQAAALERSHREQLELKDRFLSHVSHELRTPLAAIHQFVSLLLDGLAGELAEQQREYLEVAARNVDQLTSMINDLMDAVRAQSGKLRIEPRRVGLTELVGQLLESLAHRAAAQRISLQVEIDDDLPVVFADATRVEQVVTNLFENALKFTPERGSVTVRATRDCDESSFVRISISDTGRGMSEEEAARVFDRLYQADGAPSGSRAGLGLGLSICKQLVSQHGGRIWVESRPGAGSTFHFTLPEFLLSGLVRKAFLDEAGRLREQCGIVRVLLVPEEGRASGASDWESRSFYQALERLVYYPQIDVLLPRLFLENRDDVFFVLAPTDACGLEAMTARLGIYLNRTDEKKPLALRAEVAGRMLETAPGLGEAPVEQALAWAARETETILLDAGGW